MKKIGLFFLTIVSLLISSSFANNINPLELPKFQYFINDYSQVLEQEKLQELNQFAQGIETDLGPQIVTVLFPNREGNELFDITLKAFNENGIGDANKNDGLLLAIATEEKKIRIMVGYGLEGQFPDLLISNIIEEQIRPLVNQGNFSEAVSNFYTETKKILQQPIPTNTEKKEKFWSKIKESPRHIEFTQTILLILIGISIASRILMPGGLHLMIGGGLIIFSFLLLSFEIFIDIGVILSALGFFMAITLPSGRGGRSSGWGRSSSGRGYSGGGGRSGGGGAGD